MLYHNLQMSYPLNEQKPFFLAYITTSLCTAATLYFQLSIYSRVEVGIKNDMYFLIIKFDLRENIRPARIFS